MNLHTNNETDFGWDLPSIPSEKKRAKSARIGANYWKRHCESDIAARTLCSPPTLLTAFAYQAIFKKPLSDIFPGLYYTVEAESKGVWRRLKATRQQPGERSVCCASRRQMEWLWERKATGAA